MRLADNGIQFVACPDIERQPRRHPPVVMQESGIGPETELAMRIAHEDAAIIGNTREEIFQWRSAWEGRREAGIEEMTVVEVDASLAQAIFELIDAAAAHFSAKLQ